jgi:antirestriction protein ArdC
MIVRGPAVEFIPAGGLQRCAGNLKRFGNGRGRCGRLIALLETVGPFSWCVISSALPLALLRSYGRAAAALWLNYTMPWHRSVTRPVNAVTGKSYHGVNVVALWCAAASRGFRSGHWATYRQWHSAGAQVRKGERGTVVVFYKPVEQEHTDEEDEPEKAVNRPKLIARASWAFNAEQVDGWTAPKQDLPNEVEIREHVEAFIAATHAEIRHGGDMACYNYVNDIIEVPHPEQFFGTNTRSATEAYYSVVLHELTHWSGAGHRLARNLRTRFGDDADAMEELVAEFGAAFLCADLRISNEPRHDHASYVASWLRVLTKDRTALFTAASKASVAATYLANFSAPR